MPDSSQISAITGVVETGTPVSAISSQTAIVAVGLPVSAISSQTVIVEVGPTGPTLTVPNVVGRINTPVTFDGSASSADEFSWAWTSVPSGSALLTSTPGPVPYPDNAATTPIDMTNNVGLYHFDGNANDSSGNGNNGTVIGPTLISGYIGQCYDYDGSNDRIEVPHNASLNASTALTIAAWIKLDAVNAWAGLVTKGVNASNYSFQLASDGSGKLQFQSGGVPFTNRVNSNTAIPLYVWRHVAVTFDSGTVKFYINGVLDATRTVSWGLSANNESLVFGADFPGGDEYLNGRLDEAAIWTRVLSPAEIADIYYKQSQAASTSGDLGLTSSGTATLYPDNGASTPVNMTNNGALFHFNNNTTDTSGNNNGLTTSGTSFATGFDGTANGSLKFTGTAPTALLTNPVSMSGDWTVAFWFYNLLANTAWRTGTRGSNRDHQIIVQNGSDRLGVYDNNNGAFRSSGFDMPSGTYQGWHHIVAVGSGSTTTFYVNGVNVGSSDRKSTDNVYSIGNHFNGNQQFAERIDEFAAWTRALSATEIASIYSLQSAGKVSITSSATFTPDVTGTYQAQFTAFKGAFADTVTVTANITDGASTGLPSRALAGEMVGPSTLAYTALRPGALLPGGK